MMPWHKNFTERQIKEIEFCLLYAEDEDLHEFLFDTVEHNTRMIIAQMAKMFDKIHYSLAPVGFTRKHVPEIVEIMGHGEKDIEGLKLDLDIEEVTRLLNIVYNPDNFTNDLLHKKLVKFREALREVLMEQDEL